MAYYDAKGNPVTDVVPKEEFEKLQAEATAAKENYSRLEAEANKLREKSTNFDRFRNLSAEEKQKMLDKMTDSERANHDRLEALESEISAGKKERREILINQFAGNNDEMGKLIDEAAAELEVARGAPKTAAESRRLFSDAKAIVENRERQKINPVNATHFPGSDETEYYPKPKKRGNYADTDAGKDLAKDLGMMLEEPKKT